MNKFLSKISLVLAVVAGLAAAAQAGDKQLAGHVPKVMSTLTPKGRLAATNTVRLAIGLPLQNQDGLDALMAQIYDPASPNYHHFLTADQFKDHFSPTEAQWQSVVHFAQTNGFTIRGTSANRTILDVTAAVPDVERAFHVHLRTFRHPTEARDFYAPDVEPTVDAGVPIMSIGGLNNLVIPKSLMKPFKKRSQTGTSGRGFSTGSSPDGSYWGYDFRAAYCPGITLTGTGQSVALYECDGYYLSDVTSYLQGSGLPAVTLTNVLVDGFPGVPTYGGEGEVTLDIDMAISMAPGLTAIYVYEGNGADGSVADNVDTLNRIATDNTCRQISSSWLLDDSPQYKQIYEQFALQGQTFFQASGDSGSYYPGIFQFEDSPLVTLVGGTTLTSTAGAGGVWKTEQVWNNGFDPYAGHEWAGGGGISQVYKIPTWQKWINMATNQGSTTMRNIPDVALTADNIYIYTDGYPGDTGGTSAAAPLWAGYMALVNQQMVSNGVPPIGFINPTIYTLAQGANYTNLFHDIVVGNNTNNVNTTIYSAVPGYDLATGLGTPNGPNLLAALAGTGNTNVNPIVPVVISAPLPPWGNTLSVANGSNPNGAWFLFIQDDKLQDVGMINRGWSLTLNAGTSLGTPADVQVTAPANISLAYGGVTNVVIAVTNYGPVASTNVVITDTLPYTGVSLTGYSPSNSVTLLGGSLQWNVGTLATNTGSALTLTFTGIATGVVTTFRPRPRPPMTRTRTTSQPARLSPSAARPLRSWPSRPSPAAMATSSISPLPTPPASR
jgi:uncharacterized repeat protein (TIGR01451 family)